VQLRPEGTPAGIDLSVRDEAELGIWPDIRKTGEVAQKTGCLWKGRDPFLNPLPFVVGETALVIGQDLLGVRRCTETLARLRLQPGDPLAQ
jgi:hypothetical protein